MRTQKATEARMRKTDDRMATRLRGRGWVTVPPLDRAVELAAVRRLLDEDAAAGDPEVTDDV